MLEDRHRRLKHDLAYGLTSASYMTSNLVDVRQAIHAGLQDLADIRRGCALSR